MTSSSLVINAVEQQLIAAPLTAREIWKRMNCWTLSTVRNALLDLVRDGKAVKASEPFHSEIRHTYRRAA